MRPSVGAIWSWPRDLPTRLATPTATNGASVRVAKEIQTADGRLFLVESLAFASLQDQFLGLPQCMPPGGHASLNRPKDAKLRYAAIPRLPSSPIVGVQPSSEPAVPATTPQPPLPGPTIHASRITYHAVPSTTPNRPSPPGPDRAPTHGCLR